MLTLHFHHHITASPRYKEGVKTSQVYLISGDETKRGRVRLSSGLILQGALRLKQHKHNVTVMQRYFNNVARAVNVVNSSYLQTVDSLLEDSRRNKQSLLERVCTKCVDRAVNFTGLTMEPHRQLRAFLLRVLPSTFEQRQAAERRTTSLHGRWNRAGGGGGGGVKGWE